MKESELNELDWVIKETLSVALTAASRILKDPSDKSLHPAILDMLPDLVVAGIDWARFSRLELIGRDSRDGKYYR